MVTTAVSLEQEDPTKQYRCAKTCRVVGDDFTATLRHAPDRPRLPRKQDIDPTDWMGRLAANISGGEGTIEAANTLMAPETDSGLFGNPEDLNKFVLTQI